MVCFSADSISVILIGHGSGGLRDQYPLPHLWDIHMAQFLDSSHSHQGRPLLETPSSCHLTAHALGSLTWCSEENYPFYLYRLRSGSENVWEACIRVRDTKLVQQLLSELQIFDFSHLSKSTLHISHHNFFKFLKWVEQQVRIHIPLSRSEINAWVYRRPPSPVRILYSTTPQPIRNANSLKLWGSRACLGHGTLCGRLGCSLW